MKWNDGYSHMFFNNIIIIPLSQKFKIPPRPMFLTLVSKAIERDLTLLVMGIIIIGY